MGPLKGYTIIELAGIGPCPMAGMMLADMGAEVIRIERSKNRKTLYKNDISARGKKSIILDLKQDTGKQVLLKLVKTSDALIEGYRPGVTEKLGLGPNDCFEQNPALVYGRMTGWGQEGPLAQTAGHDINYIALTGALHAIGRAGQPPVPPLNLVGDFGGGALFLVSGVLAALLEAQKSGKGQVVDAAMVDGVANLMWMCHSFANNDRWDTEHREANLVDGGAFFYDSYATLDGLYIAIGPIEPQFFNEFVDKAGLDKALFSNSAQTDKSQWVTLKNKISEKIRTKTRQQWCDIFQDSDACVAPVLTLDEAPKHSHNVARSSYQTTEGFTQPNPAPRFSRTASSIQHSQHEPGQDSESILNKLGFSEEEIQEMFSRGIVA